MGVAGDLNWARQVDDKGFSTLPLGDDDALERLLNEVSRYGFNRLIADIVGLIADYLENLWGAGRNKRSQVLASNRLTELGVLWTPPDQDQQRLAPGSPGRSSFEAI